MSTGPKSGWGGKRAGSGRKPIYSLTEKERRKLMFALRKEGKKRGKLFPNLLAEKTYEAAEGDDQRLFVQFAKLILDNLMARQSEQTVNITEHKSPEIYLPEQKPDPARVVPLEVVK